jgi:stalled ribosome rescue protein Dom34
MSNLVLWLDSKKAFIFNLKEMARNKITIKLNEVSHHTRHKNDLHQNANENQFFESICSQITDGDRLLIFGPGFSKVRFNNFIKIRRYHLLERAIIQVQTMSFKSQAQIFAAAKVCFRKYNLYFDPI